MSICPHISHASHTQLPTITHTQNLYLSCGPPSTHYSHTTNIPIGFPRYLIYFLYLCIVLLIPTQNPRRNVTTVQISALVNLLHSALGLLLHTHIHTHIHTPQLLMQQCNYASS